MRGPLKRSTDGQPIAIIRATATAAAWINKWIVRYAKESERARWMRNNFFAYRESGAISFRANVRQRHRYGVEEREERGQLIAAEAALEDKESVETRIPRSSCIL